MPSIPKSEPQLSPQPLPFELLNLQHWFAMAYASIQRASSLIDAFQPQTPEGEALKDIYHDVMALCLEALQEVTTAHLPEELAAMLAFEHAELEWMLQRREGKTARPPVADPVQAAAD